MTIYPNMIRLRVIKIALFGVLVVLMMISALYLKDNASMVLANAEPIIANEQLCYSSCTFTRPMSIVLP
jgi:hemolysin-activating ACP:hemolysin acyltransferase